MKHRKDNHRAITPNCSKYLEGKCARNSEECWFIHDLENVAPKVDFQKVPENPQPPDQFQQILQVLSQMSLSMQTVVTKLTNLNL